MYQFGISLGIPEEMLGVDNRQVSRWETGKVAPGAIYTKIMCRLYDRTPDQLDIDAAPLPSSAVEALGASVSPMRLTSRPKASSQAAVDSEDDMRRRAFLMVVMGLASGAGGDLLGSSPVLSVGDQGRMEDAVLDAIGTGLDTLTRQAPALPPREVLPAVQAHLSYVQRLTSTITSSRLRTRVQTLAAQGAILVGRLHYRLDDWGTAQGHYAYSEALAEHVGNPDLRASALVLRSYLHSGIPRRSDAADTQTAIALLDQAYALSGIPSRLQVWICARRAEEYASLGDRPATSKNLDLASRLLSSSNVPDPSNALLAAWSQSRLAGYRGNCLLLLGDARGAVQVLQEALKETNSNLVAERLAVIADLAAATAISGAPDEACGLLSNALAEAHHHGLASLVNRVVGTRRRYLPGMANTSSLRDLDQHITQVGSLTAP